MKPEEREIISAVLHNKILRCDYKHANPEHELIMHNDQGCDRVERF